MSIDKQSAEDQAVARLKKYIERRKSARGLDVNEVHTFDAGDERPTCLMLSDIEILIAALPKPCEHKYMPFGSEQPRWRCANCNQLQPLSEEHQAV